MSKPFKIIDEALIVANLIDHIKVLFENDENDAIVFSAIESETNFVEIMDRLVIDDGEDEADINKLEKLIATYKTRINRAEKRIELRRSLIQLALSYIGKEKWPSPYGTITAKDLPKKILVTDESSLPLKYFKQPDPVVEKKALNADVKAWLEKITTEIETLDKNVSEDDRKHLIDEIMQKYPPIPGVSVEEGGKTIAIRRN